MNPTAVRALWRTAVLIVLLALLATSWLLLGRPLASGTSTTGAATGDTRLSEMAADIMPTIVVIERFRKEKGSYPATADNLAGRLPQDVMADTAGDTLSIDTGHGNVWGYLCTQDGQGYELTRHLPDGGSLTASNDHGTIIWSYAETDEDDPEPVTLQTPN